MAIQISNKLSALEKLSIYTKYRREPLIRKAIFSDETKNFRNPVEPKSGDKISLKIRTARDNADKVCINFYSDKYEMTRVRSEGVFDYYEYTFTVKDRVRYYYEIYKDNAVYYYNKNGLVQNIEACYDFTIFPDYITPDWAKGAVMYQIYIDRFYNGDTSNDVQTNEYIYLGKPTCRVENWHKTPAENDVHNFYGGDLKGIIDKLPYLKDLGVDVIYFNPIFVSPSNHKYDAQDYDYVDPHIGVLVNDTEKPLTPDKLNNKFAKMYIQRTTDKENLEASNKLFIKLVEAAHKIGIKIILDGVFNHCGSANKWMDKEGFYSSQKGYSQGAYRDKKSPYVTYFRWYEMHNWPNNDCYDAWWGHDNHPKLNFEASQELLDYILNLAKKWVSPPYNADGWRLDVAADVGYSRGYNHFFWKQFRKAVKEANPNAVIISENYGDSKEWLEGDEWDSIMNYDAFMEPLTWFLTGMQKHSDEFRSDLLNNDKAFESSMRYQMAQMPVQALLTSMNELSNHDHSRFLTRTNMTPGRLSSRGSDAAAYGINKGIMREAVVFQHTWIGCPTIYYGDEAGVVGWTDPDSRRTYPWGKEDTSLLQFHREMIILHKSYECLRTGSTEFLYGERGIISYCRFDDNNKIIVVLNNNSESRHVSIPVWNVGIANKLQSLISTNKDGYSHYMRLYNVMNGYANIDVDAFGSVVLLELS